MWNEVNHRRFSAFGRGYSSPYYDYLHWRRNYQPNTYSDFPYWNQYYQSTRPWSYNFKSSTNKRYNDSTLQRPRGHGWKNPVYQKNSVADLKNVNSKTSQLSQNPAASDNVCPTDLPFASVSLNNRKENSNLQRNTEATVVTESKLHTFNAGTNDCVGSHIIKTQPEIKSVPSGFVMSSSQPDIKKKSFREDSSLIAKSAEKKTNRPLQSTDTDSSFSNLYPHCEANQSKSTDISHPASSTLNLCEEKVSTSVLSKSDSSILQHPNMSPVTNFVKSECPGEQSFLKTEKFFDRDYSNLASISKFDVFVKREAPDRENSEGHDLERKRGFCDSKVGESFLLSASTMKKNLSDVVQLQPLSLSGTVLSQIETSACKSREHSDKTENFKSDYKSSDQDHKGLSISIPKDIQSTSPAATFKNLSVKPNVKSEIEQTDFLETCNKGLEQKYASEGKHVKYLSTYRVKSRRVGGDYDEQLSTNTSTIVESGNDKCEMLSLNLTDSGDVKPNVKTGNEGQHDLKHSRTCVEIDGVIDECPLGHFLIPTDATFNIRTGRITVLCRHCNLLVYMKSNIDFV